MKRKLANIITESSKIKFNLPVNKCDSMDCRDEKLPTLIIGYELAKQYVPDFSILKKHYEETNIYWTFRRNERGVDYEKDLKSFYSTVINDFCNKKKYVFVDIINLGFVNAKKLIGFIKSDERKLVFNENNRFLYIYCEKYNSVFGFSLSTSRFFGLDTRKLVCMVKKNKHNVFIDSFSRIPYEVKNIIGEKIDKYLAIYDYFAE